MKPCRRRSVLCGTLVTTAGIAWPKVVTAAGPWRDLLARELRRDWQVFLRGPRKDDEPLGIDNDPNGVCKMVRLEGEPVLRISGQDWGAVTTRASFANYHLRLEWKWGTLRWPPREQAKRDSGLLYHCVGPHGAGSGAWMRSFECQIQEGDCGDFHSVDGVVADIRAAPHAPGQRLLQFRPDAELRSGVAHRVMKSQDAERPSGLWNVLDLYAVGARAVHVINGVTVMVLENLRQRVEDEDVALTAGRLQLQSEGAEIFYRRLRLRPITRIPARWLPQQAFTTESTR